MRRNSICAVVWLCLAALAYGQGERSNLERRRLSRPTDLQGFRCAADYAWFYPGGALESCRVERDTPFGEARVGAGSWIFLRSDGKPWSVFLRHDTKIGQSTCMGSAMGREGSSTVFFPSGKLKLCFLAADQEIQGVPCAHGGFFSGMFGGDVSTEFYENGELHACRAARAVTVRGKRFARGERVRLRAIESSPGGGAR